jgi:hypothetical protein
MYHKASEVLQKVKVINTKAEELERLIAYMGRQKIVITVDMDRLESQKEYLISDIQALCREIANDTGDTT